MPRQKRQSTSREAFNVLPLSSALSYLRGQPLSIEKLSAYHSQHNPSLIPASSRVRPIREGDNPSIKRNLPRLAKQGLGERASRDLSLFSTAAKPTLEASLRPRDAEHGAWPEFLGQRSACRAYCTF